MFKKPLTTNIKKLLRKLQLKPLASWNNCFSEKNYNICFFEISRRTTWSPHPNYKEQKILYRKKVKLLFQILFFRFLSSSKICLSLIFCCCRWLRRKTNAPFLKDNLETKFQWTRYFTETCFRSRPKVFPPKKSRSRRASDDRQRRVPRGPAARLRPVLILFLPLKQMEEPGPRKPDPRPRGALSAASGNPGLGVGGGERGRRSLFDALVCETF